MRLREIKTSYQFHNVKAPVSTISEPAKVAHLFKEIFNSSDVEHGVVFNLDTKNSVISFYHVSKGSASETMFHPRDLFKTAIADGASAVIMAHNHPSENLTFSKEDIACTRRMIEVSKVIGITMLDHVVVNSRTGEYSSYIEQGY